MKNGKHISSAARWLGSFCGLLAFCSWLSGCVLPPAQKLQRWAAFYGETSDWQQFENLDLVIFDADKHPPIAPLKERGVKVLAYLSVAEIAPYREYAAEMLHLPDFVIGYQERWNSSVIDIRSPIWQKHILEVQLPGIIAQGFDGVMIDTLDSALMKAAQDPMRLSGTQDASVALISRIRQNLPSKAIIMVNRGFDILPQIADNIDIILAESILVDARVTPVRTFDDTTYKAYVDKLQQLRYKNTHLSIFTLDYLPIQDMNAKQNIECVQRGHGFSPYVATLDLQKFEPSALTHCESGDDGNGKVGITNQ